MGMRTRNYSLVLLVALAAAGCAHIDMMHAKLDMAEQHLGSPKPFYEGRLTSWHRFGPMTSLQFADGQLFDVAKAPAGLAEGDIVRVFKTDHDYEAHLWRSAEPELPSPETNTLAPAIRSK